MGLKGPEGTLRYERFALTALGVTVLCAVYKVFVDAIPELWRQFEESAWLFLLLRVRLQWGPGEVLRARMFQRAGRVLGVGLVLHICRLFP